VTSLAVDPSSNFFLSGSSDAMVHVWSLPAILSFSPDTSRSPVHTLSTHRGPISSVVCGHSSSSANIAVSISGDKSAIVWDYQNGQMLRTYLLPEAPTAVALDPADRAFYVAYADGSLQTIDFYDEVQKNVPTDVLRDPSSSHRPVQPSSKTGFSADSQKLGGALSLSLSWDGTTLLSGHTSGKVAAWDLAKSNYLSTLANLPGPVSNLTFLTPTGFLRPQVQTFKIHTVVKPKQDAGSSGAGSSLVPAGYTLNMQFTGRLQPERASATESMLTTKTDFEKALTHPSFPTSMLEESLAELDTWTATSSKRGDVSSSDFMALDNGDADSAGGSHTELNELRRQVTSLERIQKVTFSQLSELREQNEHFVSQQKKRAERAKTRAKNRMGLTNGAVASHANRDVEMMDDEESESESDSDDAGTAQA
jgi:pre-rRNA-processing protein IPI3